MDRSTHLVRLAKWQKVVEACGQREPGMTVKQWLVEQGISDKAYYYWLRKIRLEAFTKMELSNESSSLAVRESSGGVTFAEVSIPATTADVTIGNQGCDTKDTSVAAVIRGNNVMIELYNGATPAMVNAIVQAVHHAC